jgi:hypothetical protein
VQKRTLGILLLIASFATSGFAADRVIQNGIDVWATRGDGLTFTDFAKKPIPAGFFCPESAPFTGRLAFEGVPIVTDIPGALGATDTIVQRLDNAVFNKRGVAVTRLQFRALSLKSIAPIETACGKFDVTVSLDGVQPITRMIITRENQNGGHFSAPLALNTKVSFTPVGRPSVETLELPMEVHFPDASLPWRSKSMAPVPPGFVRVDTDGDRVPDTYLPGTSNFFAGQASRPNRQGGAAAKPGGQYYCHDAGEEHEHCIWLCSGCQIP